MADLDDFFAKKDRKKSKAKKFATTEEVAKKLEDTTKKPEKPQKKDRSQEGEDANVEPVEQDEWRDFEEEKKDYTGLKIGNLTINNESESNNGGQEGGFEQQQTTYDEAGNEVEKKVGPWKKVHDVPAEQQQQQQQRVEEKKPEPVVTPNVVSGTYVPPSKRNQPTQQQPLQPTRLRSKAAPDIHNEEFFPTLSSTKDKRGRNEGTFEVVSHSKSNSLRYVEQTKSSGQGAKLSLGNRFNTLSNDS